MPIFPECATGHPDDHWFLKPICQAEGCGRPVGDYPHNEVGAADQAAFEAGLIERDDRWHEFVAPPEPLVWGENAFRGNHCSRGRNWGTDDEQECSCRCHWGTYYVNVYRLDQGYGGPEEGGWYYETGEPIGSVPCTSLRQAETHRDLYEKTYPQGRNRYSVAPRDEDYGVYIERHFAEAFPIERPRYE